MNHRVKGIAPVAFRDEFAFLHYPVVIFGRHKIEQFVFWKGKCVRDIVLTNQELKDICTWYQHYGFFFSKIHETLQSSYDFNGRQDVALRLWAALIDIDAAAALCEIGYAMVNSYYMCVQSIEKSMKSFLMWKGCSDDELRRLGHNLTKTLDHCRGIDIRYDGYELPLERIQWDQNWRYNPVNVSHDDIIRSFDLALQLCAQTCECIKVQDGKFVKN